ncbi:MAG: O-antigen ligase family protein [Aestuariivirga sp.]
MIAPSKLFGSLSLADGMLLAVLVLSACAGLALALNDPMSLALVFGLPLLAVAAMVVWHALAGDKFALLIVLAGAIFMLDAVVRVRAYDDKAIDFQIMLKAGSWALLALLAMNGLGAALRSMFSTERLLWTLLFGYLLLTSLYAPSPVYSVVAAFSIVSFYLFFAGTLHRLPVEHVMIAILIGIAALAIGSLIVYFAVPSLGRMRIWSGNQQILSMRLSGLAGHANSIGRLCCLGIILLAVHWKQLRAFWRPAPLLTLLLLATTLLLSNSRTSIAITVIVLAVYWFGKLRVMPYLLLAAAFAAVILVAVTPYSEQIMAMLSRSGDADEIMTGTSRTHIWAVANMLGSQRPWFGWGYGSSVFVMPAYQDLMGHAAPHAHNIFLQLWMTTGIVGVMLFVAALVSRFLLAVWRDERLVIALLLFVFFNGLTESSAFGGVANITSVVLCLAAAMGPAGRIRERAVARLGRLQPSAVG